MAVPRRPGDEDPHMTNPDDVYKMKRQAMLGIVGDSVMTRCAEGADAVTIFITLDGVSVEGKGPVHGVAVDITPIAARKFAAEVLNASDEADKNT